MKRFLTKNIIQATLVALLVLIVDQVSKYFVRKLIPIYSKVELIPNFFNLVHVENSGIAFGFFNNPGIETTGIFSVISIIAIGVIFYIIITETEKSPFLAISLGMILGGAIGNLIDRLFWGSFTDFIDLYLSTYHWPAFNVADMSISMGGFFILLSIFKRKKYASHFN